MQKKAQKPPAEKMRAAINNKTNWPQHLFALASKFSFLCYLYIFKIEMN